jgi:hypothetical protein
VIDADGAGHVAADERNAAGVDDLVAFNNAVWHVQRQEAAVEWDATGIKDVVVMVAVGRGITVIKVAAIANAIGHIIRRRTADADAASVVAIGVTVSTVAAAETGVISVDLAVVINTIGGTVVGMVCSSR